MSEPQLRPQFLGGEGGRIFVVLRRPAGHCMQCVLIVPPFAEEMNKSRRMTALTAHALAVRGLAVAMPDLYGTGDSEGSFDEATWERWVADIARTQHWCEQQGLAVTGMIASRLGCALGAEAMRRGGTALNTAVFWQPVVDGARALDQFLRLRAAASLMSNEARETVKDLRGRLRNGETLEVAGYGLSAALAAALDEVKLSASGLAVQRLHWMEVVRSEGAAMPLPSASAVEAFRAQGHTVECHQLIGEPFWSSTEVVVLPELIRRTVAAFCEAQ